MKSILFVVLTSILSASVAFADSVYLKDGSIVRGTITSEDEKAVLVETGNTWKQISKGDVERIIRDDKSLQRISPPSGLQPMPPVEQIVVPPLPPQQPMGYRSSMNLDIRVKAGSAAGAKEVEFATSTGTVDTDKHGGNVQVEAVMSPFQGSMAGPVFSVGAFGRQHSGKIVDTVRTTTVDYDASGVSLAGGLRLKSSEHFHFEVKVEVGLGQGGVTLESPTYTWNRTRDAGYTSAALIVGWYYAFSKPGLQLGLELGAQSFTGEFDILNSTGRWERDKVTGSGATANVAVGVHF